MNLEKIKKIIFHPLFIAGIIILSLHFFNITRYEFIADKDSYGWILKYSNIQPDSLYFYRQLFSALIFTLHYLTGLDLFGIFKYLFPFFSMCALLPLWLVARKLSDKKFQTLILLAAAASPTIIIQLEGARPQVMAMLYLYFMLGLSVMAWEKKNYNWLYGLFIPLTAISSLFHRVFVLFLALWTIAAAYTYRKIIYRNKIKVIILLGLLYPWIDKLEMRTMTIKIFKSIYDIFQNIFLRFSINLKFPAYYINVDGKQMGWENLTGVLKYYAFYVGPFLVILILAGLYFIVSRKNRDGIKNNLNLEYFLPIYLFLTFFLLIAEFLPRFGNMAYLPDRAWIFLGILLAWPLFKLLSALERNSKPIVKNAVFGFLIFGFVISLSGAAYVNSQFSYIAPPYKMDSFRWMKENLDSDRVVFYYGWQGLLRYHSNTPVIGIKKDFIRKDNLSGIMKTLYFKDTIAVTDENIKLQINEIGTIFSEMQEISKSGIDRKNLFGNMKQMRAKSSQLFSDLNVNPDLSAGNTAYIYYAKDSDKNPYRERMWETGYSANVSANAFAVLDNNPQYFQKVYDTGDVKIWKYIPDDNN